MGPLLGIDVSSNNESTALIDWPLVSQTQQFAWVKATEGTGYVNSDFARDFAAAKAAGLKCGAYHFARPDDNLPEAEADYFIWALGDGTAPDMVCLDLEVGTGPLGNWAERFLQRMQARLGRPCWIYSNAPFLDEHGVGQSKVCTAAPLWLAAYQDHEPDPPAGWDHITMWQFTDRAGVSGVAGGVDQSWWYLG